MSKKGLRYLVDACFELRQRGHDVDCRIVGDGPERSLLCERIAELDLEEHVHLLGAVPHERLMELWRTAHVFALPCVETKDGNRDGIPVALMEVMALGVPVVATSISGIGELVRDRVTGLLVEPADSEALAEAIEELLLDRRLATRLARAARAEIEAAYDIDANARQKANLFDASSAVSTEDVEERLSKARLIELERAIDAALQPAASGSVVQLVNIGEEPGLDLASDFAHAVSANSHKRVLLVSDKNTSPSANPERRSVSADSDWTQERSVVGIELESIQDWLSIDGYGTPCLWQMAREMFDLVVVDSPLDKAAAMATQFDGTVLIADERTTRRQAFMARDAVLALGGRLLGVVLTRQSPRQPRWLNRLLT